MPQVLAGLAVAAPFVLGIVTMPPATPTEAVPAGLVASPGGAGHEVFRFADPAITEASALVVQDGLFLTVNDSGDSGRVFVVDRSGATVDVTAGPTGPPTSRPSRPAGPASRGSATSATTWRAAAMWRSRASRWGAATARCGRRRTG